MNAAHDDPPPAEVIPDLDLIDFEWRGFGSVWPMSEKRARRARAKMAADLMDRGEPFVWRGVRVPGDRNRYGTGSLNPGAPTTTVFDAELSIPLTTEERDHAIAAAERSRIPVGTVLRAWMVPGIKSERLLTMTYDKQDLLLDLRKLATDPDREHAHREADRLLLQYVDDEHIAEAHKAASW